MKPAAQDEDAVALAARLSEHVAALLGGRTTPAEVLAALAAPPPPKNVVQLTLVPEPPPAEGPREIAKRVFAYWQRRCGHERAKMTAERIGKVLARLREGYTEQECYLAIEGCLVSPHHSGENDRGTVYNDLELILRSGTKLEYFRRLAEEHGAKAELAPKDQNPEDRKRDDEIARLRGEAALAKKEGRIDDYNQHVRSLRALEQRVGAR